jgi:hypothetical protein
VQSSFAKGLLTVLGMIAVLVSSSTSATASGGPKPSDPQNAPTFQQQSKNWTAAQSRAYDAKLKQVRALASANSSSTVQPNCPFSPGTVCGPPSTAYAQMTIVYEGSADCACGPATADEMFSTTNYYYASPSSVPSLATVESQMGFNCSVGTYRYQLANELNGYQSANTYVWQAVNSASDVHYYTQVDLGSYAVPIAYDGETYGPDGHPLDNYQNVNWKHYFPAYGYSPGYLTVDDPHFAASHTYSDQAVYLFIDNFPYANQVLW